MFALSHAVLAQGHSDRYNVSVFSNFQELKPEKGFANITDTRQKIQTQFPGWYIETDKWTGGFKDINGAPKTISGATLVICSRHCMIRKNGAGDLYKGEACVQSPFLHYL